MKNIIDITKHNLSIYNSLTKKKEKFKPIQDKKVSIYSCGLTPNKRPHIGHAIAAVRANLLRRYLVFLGYEVTYCQNITDVDDKIIEEAKSLNIHPNDVVNRNLKEYNESLLKLGLEEAEFSPKVSLFIDQIIKYIQNLIDKGFAYVDTKGNVYFDVSKYDEYGKLNNVKLEDLLTGVRVDNDEEKANPVDFALWKNDDFIGASWDSPWGLGRPGWHIECSVMANSIFGPTIDIHCGGRDLKFPHHENEIAQCEAHNDVQFSNYWCHFGLMRMSGAKMSKSLGNIITMSDCIKDMSPELFLFSILKTHYRSDINWSDHFFIENLNNVLYAHRSIEMANDELKKYKIDYNSKMNRTALELRNLFNDVMSDDFSSHRAIVILLDYIKIMRKKISTKKDMDEMFHLKNEIIDLGKTIGIFISPMNINKLEESLFNFFLKKTSSTDIKYSELKEHLQKRPLLRSQKDFKALDSGRDLYFKYGILINDNSDGSSWSFEIKKFKEKSII